MSNQPDISKLIGYKQTPYTKTYTEKDAIMYSLGIGF